MQYKIVSTVRSPLTRGIRHQSKTREMVQFIGGRRLVRGRDMLVQDEFVLNNLNELKRRERDGQIFVTMMDGRRLDLTTLEPVSVVVPVLMPHPPVDCLVTSTANAGRFESPPLMQGGLPMAELVKETAEEVSSDAEDSGESVADMVLRRGRNRGKR